MDLKASNSIEMQGFNDDGEDTHKRQPIVKMYSPNFDLSTLKKHTSNITKSVYLWADIVYMSDSIDITYDLKIRARKVFINRPLTMKVDIEKFEMSNNYLVLEKQFEFKNGLLMRHRKYGRVDILDRSPSKKKHCSPKIFPSEESFQKLSKNFDIYSKLILFML